MNLQMYKNTSSSVQQHYMLYPPVSLLVVVYYMLVAVMPQLQQSGVGFVEMALRGHHQQ
jgi:hypothetical protein